MKIRFEKAFKLLTAAGILTELLYLSFIFLNGSGNIPLYMFIYFESFLIFFAAGFILKRTEDDEQGSGSSFQNFVRKFFKADDRTAAKLFLPVLIILSGILFRITLIPSPPTTSPDVYRYVWEGKILTEGYNPYLISPDDPQLETLRDDVYERVTFKHIPAIYPPLSQMMFAANYLLIGGVTGLKTFYLISEILTLIFLLKLLLLKNKNPNLILLYAWLPLPVLEFFVNAHLDPPGITLLVIFIYFAEKKKYILSAVPFALSFLIKLFPLMFIPLMIKKAGVKKFLAFAVTFFGITFLFYLPFIYNDPDIAEFLLKYLSRWEFNGSVYNLLKFFSNGEIAREICAALMIVSAAIISTRYIDFTKAVFGIFLCYIIFAATVYPWYLGWLAALNPFAGFASAMSLFFTINFSNFTPLADVWREYVWVLLIQYIPFFFLLLYDLNKMKKERIKV